MIVVIAPAHAVTGGPEALHQLVHTANQLKPGSAAICYHPFGEVPPVPAPYQIYDTPVIRVQDIPSDARIVLPEIWPEMADWFQQPCALWWLSVDNYGTHGQRDLSGIELHLFQSDYAAEHGRSLGLPGEMLTDYLNPMFMDLDGTTSLAHKDRCIAVNPAKGRPLLDRFTAENPDIEVRLIRGLDRLGVVEVLSSSMVYIDFGHQPGRDRPPREAAMAKCVVFANNQGAARMWGDMCLPGHFKFDSLDGLGDRVRQVLDSRESLLANFDVQRGYRSWVRDAERNFRDEVWELLAWAALG
jgi:hypothetical protein